MLTTLMLSFGVPMLLGGDEMGRTQNGNNNAYSQDNEITWFDWDSADKELLDFTRQLAAFRRAHPVFRRRRFLAGAEATELQWFTPQGRAMDGADWADPGALAIGIYRYSLAAPDIARGRRRPGCGARLTAMAPRAWCSQIPQPDRELLRGQAYAVRRCGLVGLGLGDENCHLAHDVLKVGQGLEPFDDDGVVDPDVFMHQDVPEAHGLADRARERGSADAVLAEQPDCVAIVRRRSPPFG